MVKVSLQKRDRITRTISALETGGAHTNKRGNLAVSASLTPQVEFRRQKAQSVPFYCVSACVSWIFLNFERKDHLFFMCVVILRVLMSLIPFYTCICRISQVLSELLHIHRPKLMLEPGLTHTSELTLEYMAPLSTSPLRIQMIDAAGLALSAWQVRLRGSPARRLTTGPPLMTGFSGGTETRREDTS